MTSRFLITGYPRSRTAWLAALLCVHGVETIHERPLFFRTMDELSAWLLAGTDEYPHGLVDAFAACSYPDFALSHYHFADQPIVIIERDFDDAVTSWINWYHIEPTYLQLKQVKANYKYFNDNAADALHVKYEALDDFETVSNICKFTTGRELQHQTFQLFNHLQIELHKQKAWNYIEANNITLGRNL